MAEIAAGPLRADLDFDFALLRARLGAGIGHAFFRGFLGAGFFAFSEGAEGAGAGEGAPGASPFAFSSPGSTYSGPSHGISKSKLRKPCGTDTGSQTTRSSTSA